MNIDQYYRIFYKNVLSSIGAKYSKIKEDIFSLVPPGGYWRDILEDIVKDYMKSCRYIGCGRTGILRRLSLDEPSLTFLTTTQMKQTDRCHPTERLDHLLFDKNVFDKIG